MKGKEPTEEELKRYEEGYKFQQECEHEDELHEIELDIEEAELESKIKKLERLKRLRRRRGY